MQKLMELLNQTKLITTRANTMMLEKQKRGENFNIFEVLNLAHYEEKLHTPFITELLNPQGSHGLKDSFLKAFIEIAKIDLELDFETVTVSSEYYIGNKTDDCTNGGRLDIYVCDRMENAIIIENKIYAKDQESQLLRYHNYAKNRTSKHKLLYLTLEGDEASIESLGHKKVDYECISYRNTILKWLERCVELSACYPLVRETIRQYIINIKSLLNMMDSDNLNELIKVTTSKEYIESTLDIISNVGEITTRIRKNFVESLSEIAKRNNLLMEYNEEICSLRNDSYIYFYNPKLSEHWAIYLYADKHNSSDGVYVCISQIKQNKPRVNKTQIAEIDHIWEEGDQTSVCPFGWNYLYGDNGNWWKWSDTDTLKDMINGKLAAYIEDKIIKPVLKKKLLQKIEHITTK